MSNTDYHEVLWPRAARKVSRKALAPRPASLEGKVIAQAWDYLFRGDEVFAALEEGLKARYPGVKFIGFDAIGNTHVNDERAVVAAMPAKLKSLGADAVISGTGC